MTPRAQWLLAACGLAVLALAFVWGLAAVERRLDTPGVRHAPVGHASR